MRWSVPSPHRLTISFSGKNWPARRRMFGITSGQSIMSPFIAHPCPSFRCTSENHQERRAYDTANGSEIASDTSGNPDERSRGLSIGWVADVRLFKSQSLISPVPSTNPPTLTRILPSGEKATHSTGFR